jgi:hypothetical protein
MPKNCQPPNKFTFVQEKIVNEAFLMQPRHMWEELAARTERGVFWTQPNGKGGSRCWNLTLLRSYLAFGSESVH